MYLALFFVFVRFNMERVFLLFRKNDVGYVPHCFRIVP